MFFCDARVPPPTVVPSFSKTTRSLLGGEARAEALGVGLLESASVLLRVSRCGLALNMCL